LIVIISKTALLKRMRGARISNKFNYIPRKDFQIYRKGELESVFVEVICDKGPNIILGCIYRHPSPGFGYFQHNLFWSFRGINTEKKQIIIMGDFNVDLLYTDTNLSSDTFLQNNIENCLQPLQTYSCNIT